MRRGPFLPSLMEGWHVLRANCELCAMTVVIVLTNAAEGAYATALILKLKTVAGANELEIGLVLAVAGVGAVLGSRHAARIRRHLGHRTAFFWPIWGLAALYLAVILDWPIWALCALSFARGRAVALLRHRGVVLPPGEHRGAPHGPRGGASPARSSRSACRP